MLTQKGTTRATVPQLDCTVVGYTTTYAIRAYHTSWRAVLDTTLCDKVSAESGVKHHNPNPWQ
jgi:hypothetical protein